MTTATIADNRTRMNPILKIVIYLVCASAILAFFGLIFWGANTGLGIGVKALFKALSWPPFWREGVSNLWVGVLGGSAVAFLATCCATVFKALHTLLLWVKHLGD